MKTLFCIGELLIDWISTDIDSSLVESVNFIKKAGGAPANAAIACSRLGGDASFAGKVGNDAFGLFLKNILVQDQINTENLILDEKPTTFAFVSIKKDGERDFIFQRGADELLKFEELNLPENNAVFHFGSATGFLGGDLQKTYFKTLEYALDKAFFISFDPNFRGALWQNPSEFITLSQEFISKADLIKLSEEEAQLISGKIDLNEAILSLKLKENAIVCVTLGKAGTLLYQQRKFETIPSISVSALDSTGAGDAFIGAVLKQICDQVPHDFDTVKQYIAFANKVAAISTTQFGAIEAMPTLEQMKEI